MSNPKQNMKSLMVIGNILLIMLVVGMGLVIWSHNKV